MTPTVEQMMEAAAAGATGDGDSLGEEPPPEESHDISQVWMPDPLAT